MKKIKSNQKYPNTLKRKIAKEYLSGKFSYAVAAEEYGLKNRGVVREFVKWYRKNGDIEPMQESDPKKDLTPPSNSVAESKESATLREQLESARLRIAGLETLIEVAEKELQIEIRKKSGTKPLK